MSRAPTILVFALAAATFLALVPYGTITRDEGWLLESAWRVSLGEIPHRDFASIYPGGRYLLMAALLTLSGSTLTGLRVGLALLRAAASALTFSVGRQWMPPPLALAAAAATTLLPGPWHKTLYVLVPLAITRAWQAWCAAPGPTTATRVGLVAGVGLWFRQDTALLGLAAVLCASAARALADPTWRSPTRALLLRAPAAALGVALAVLSALAPWVSPAVVLRDLVVDAVVAGAPGADAADAAVWGEHDRYGPRALSAWTAVSVAAPLLVLSSFTASLRALRHGADRDRATQLLAVGLLAALSANQLFRSNPLTRFLQDGAPFFLLWFAGAAPDLARLTDRARSVTARALALAALAAALAGPVLLFEALRPRRGTAPIPVEFSGTLSLLERTHPLEVDGRTFFVDRVDGTRIDIARAILDRFAPADAAVLILPGPGAVYALTGRRNPTRFVRWTPDHPDRLAHVRDRLDAGAIDLLLTDAVFLERADPAWTALLEARCVRIADQGPLTLWRVAP